MQFRSIGCSLVLLISVTLYVLFALFLLNEASYLQSVTGAGIYGARRCFVFRCSINANVKMVRKSAVRDGIDLPCFGGYLSIISQRVRTFSRVCWIMRLYSLMFTLQMQQRLMNMERRSARPRSQDSNRELRRPVAQKSVDIISC